MISRYIICGLFILLINTPLLTGQKVWKEKEGIVIIETEDVNSGDLNNSKWKLKKDAPGYTGSGYIRWEGKSMGGNENNIISYVKMENERVLDYAVEITKTGTYYLRVRNYHVHVDGDNDCFVSMNYGHFNKTWDSDVKVFSYDNNHINSNKIKILKKGIYRISLGGRSKGFCVDRLVLLHQDVTPDNWGAAPYLWMEETAWATATASEIWIDDTAPSSPENLQLVYDANDTLTFTWNPSHDENGIAMYKIFNAEKTFLFRPDTFMMVKGLKNPEYNFSVKAIDGAGNHSYRSNTLDVYITDVQNNMSQKDRIIIYPNPASSFFTIDIIDENISIKKIGLSTINGRVIEHFKYKGDEKSITISIEHLKKDAYFLIIKLNEQSLCYPLLIN